ncbi:hypothetical protein N1851_015714 [Merluccius polli]|uniref:Uncharacterized protein n=1 Tax=Merluccius polli TaxID=89951 RepID=A0AA47MRL7_MERPO|nr:hypothetical protein N1851_015714 [Merluccius polli]
MFRMALIGGLPKEVQMALENVVGLANKPQREGEDHIRHFTEKYNSRLAVKMKRQKSSRNASSSWR